MSDAFYVAEAGRFVSTELTRGPWDPRAQHGGPPAALLARALEGCPSPLGHDGETWPFGRVTCEVLGPVPIAPLEIDARVLRPGRSVELVEASLRADGREAMRATGWRLRPGEVPLPAGLASTEPESPARRSPQPPPPQDGRPGEFFDTGQEIGYHTAMDYRFTSGRFVEPGPATVWLRMRYPLLAGESPSPLQRVMIAADSGNGVSATLDWSRFLFINVDLSVHLHRLPAGEWVGLDAITVPERNRVGLADSALHDERGPIGRALQTLLVRERDE